MSTEENKMISNLEIKTGKSLKEWIEISRNSGIVKHKELIDFLKTEHRLTYGYANLVAHKSKGSDAASAANTDDLIDAQYAGEKKALKPIYNQLITIIKAFGTDVEIAPKKTYVSIRRNKQFALIQPSTKNRIDVGINLKGVSPQGKLEASGSFNSMVSHRVRVESSNDLNSVFIAWLRQAYEAS